MSNHRRGTLAAFLVAVSCLFAPTFGMEKADRKAAKKMLKEAGRLYLRVDVPCKVGRHPYGTYRAPLVDVSPEKSTSDAVEGQLDMGWWTSNSTFWPLRVNHPVEFDEADFEDDWVEITIVGLDEVDGEESVLKFVDIDDLEDFRAAFELAFSDKPLQDEHPDWSAEIREAIGKRRLVEGMSKRQAYYVTGAPVRVDKSEEDGKTVEEWELRTSKGVEVGYWTSRTGETTGLPGSIKFVDGVLTEIGEAVDPNELSLDD